MDLEFGQIITQIISFLIMLWVLKRYAWKPLLQLLEERTQRIQRQQQGIEEEKEQLLRERDEYNAKVDGLDVLAQQKMNQAIEAGQQIAKTIEAQARDQARAILEKAKRDAKSEIRKAEADLKVQLVNLTLAATEKVCKSDLTPEKQSQLIADFVNQAEVE